MVLKKGVFFTLTSILFIAVLLIVFSADKRASTIDTGSVTVQSTEQFRTQLENHTLPLLARQQSYQTLYDLAADAYNHNRYLILPNDFTEAIMNGSYRGNDLNSSVPFSGGDILAAGDAQFGFVGNNTIGDQVQNRPNLKSDEGSWLYIATTYDNSTAELRTYINGVLVDTKTIPDPAAINITASSILVGGRAAGSEPFAGMLDDILIYNTTLDASQVASITSGSPPATNMLRDYDAAVSPAGVLHDTIQNQDGVTSNVNLVSDAGQTVWSFDGASSFGSAPFPAELSGSASWTVAFRAKILPTASREWLLSLGQLSVENGVHWLYNPVQKDETYIVSYYRTLPLDLAALSAAAASIGYNVTFGTPSITISQSGAFQGAYSMTFDYNLSSNDGSVSYTRTITLQDTFLLNGIPDVYYDRQQLAQGWSDLRAFQQFQPGTWNNSQFSNFSQKEAYFASSEAPSIFNRLQGSSAANQFGVETTIPRTVAPAGNLTSIDWQYFTSTGYSCTYQNASIYPFARFSLASASYYNLSVAAAYDGGGCPPTLP